MFGRLSDPDPTDAVSRADDRTNLLAANAAVLVRKFLLVAISPFPRLVIVWIIWQAEAVVMISCAVQAASTSLLVMDRFSRV